MPDDSPAASPAPGTPPPRTTGGNWRWEPPTAAELQALMPGYTIEKLLGRGGMGAVYRGVQTNLDRPVAIKILPPGVEKEDPSFAERFKSEARLMAKLNHPAVVAVYDFGTTSAGQLYFAMEYVDGSDVSQMIAAQKKLPPEHALAITAHVCDALAAAHELGIVHRDIKPANVLLNMKGQVKVADFGLAKIEDPGQHGLTKTGYAMGTPDFVAPEALTLGAAIDGRADLYAVGVMLYQMLTGNIPRGAFKPASVLVPGLDPRYDPIIQKAMQHDREERHQSAMELRRALDVILTVPLVRHNAPESAAIPVAQMAQAPGQRSAAQKPVGKPPQPKSAPGTPARQEAAPAAKSTQSTTQAPAKSNTPLFIGIGVAAVLAIGAFVMFGGSKKAQAPGAVGNSTPPSKPAVPATPSSTLKPATAIPPKAEPKAAMAVATPPPAVSSSKPAFSPSTEPWVDALADPAALKLTGDIKRTAQGLEHNGGGSRATFTKLTGPDYAVRMIVECLGGNQDAAAFLYLRHGRQGYYIRFSNTEHNFSVGRYTGKFENLKLYKVERTLKQGERYELEARIVGSKITVKFDGVTLGTAEDDSLKDGPPALTPVFSFAPCSISTCPPRQNLPQIPLPVSPSPSLPTRSSRPASG